MSELELLSELSLPELELLLELDSRHLGLAEALPDPPSFDLCFSILGCFGDYLGLVSGLSFSSPSDTPSPKLKSFHTFLS